MPVEKVTYCRICEASCGMVATIGDDGRLQQLRPDPEHPLSRGFACPKGIAMADVQNDPERVLHPMRRRPDGTFEQVTWDEALDDIAARVRASVRAGAGDGMGFYFGNPAAFSYSHTLWLKGFTQALGIKQLYSAGSQDVNNRFVASRLLYGQTTVVPMPDLDRTDFLLMVGANPVVSHGSLIAAPRMKEQLKAIVARGGRVVVVDPRRSETAALFEHVPVRPDGDAWLLLALLHVIFAEGLEDAAAIKRQSRGVDLIREAAAAYAPEDVESQTGLPAADVRRLARDLATAGRAAVYGRTGTCLGRQGTLVAYLLDVLALVTGNLDAPGGSVFGSSPLYVEDLGHRIGALSYAKTHSRIGGFPDVLGTYPAALMAREITTPGPGRLHTLFVSAGNPVLSVPDGPGLEEAFGSLDLLVSFDLYINETNKHAHYVLPATTFLEREDAPLPFLQFFTKPFIQFTDAVVEPYGEAWPEWRIMDEIALRAGAPTFTAPVLARLVGGLPGRALGRLRRGPVRVTPQFVLDLVLRTGSRGDLWGVRRGGLSLSMLRRAPHGLVLDEEVRTGVLPHLVRHRDKKVRLDVPEIAAELDALPARFVADEEYPLQLIGLRELRSQNSWMHNAPTLMKGKRRHTMRMHPKDAAEAGLSEGDVCRLTSRRGSVELPVSLTEEVRAGTVAVPHGWGHAGGWTRANRAGGVNVNVLASTEPDDLERLAGMAVLNGISVRAEPAR